MRGYKASFLEVLVAIVKTLDDINIILNSIFLIDITYYCINLF